MPEMAAISGADEKKREGSHTGIDLEVYSQGRVTVIIPSYNYANFILQSIHSVLKQNFSDVEIIVVDDGSTDNTSEVLKPYRNRIKYIYQENAGLSAARNNGISNSTGEFILFLDADDVLGPDAIASQVAYLERNPAAFVAVCVNKLFREKDSNGQPKPLGSWALYRKNLGVHLCYFNIAPPHAFLFRRQAIIKTGWFDHQLTACEDYDFWLRAAVQGFVPHYNPAGLVYYRRHPKSMSANLLNQHLHDAILHRRLSTLIDQYHSFPEGQRFEGLLAFSAGAILTAARLHGHKLQETHQLVELASKRIEEAKEIACLQKKGWNILTKLFYFRIVSFLAMPCFRNSHTATIMRETLSEILAAIEAPASTAGLLADALTTTITGSRLSYEERREIKLLPWRYLENCLWLFLKKF